MRRMFILYIVVLLLNGTVVQSVVSLDLKSHVVGTVIAACEQEATLHTAPGQPQMLPDTAHTVPFSFPTSKVEGSAKWIIDNHTKCPRDTKDVLAYCKETYQSHDTVVTHVLPVPFPFPMDQFSSLKFEHLDVAEIFWCLSAPKNATPPFANGNETEKVTHKHHLPSLLDVHRAYFADRFRNLLNTTRMNVSHVIHSLVNETRGLRSLVRDNPRLAPYLISKLLKQAHQRLEQVWSGEESEWTAVEQAQHADSVRQLDEEDWASQKEFTYTLQEAGGNIDRVQDAVTRLLTTLTASVKEEIRHLNAVRTEQPWMLHLDSGLNRTEAVSSHVTDVERVHQVLLNYVRQATGAINTLRELMAKELRKKATSNPVGSTSSTVQPYKSTLVASYNQLQQSLFDAQRLLNSVKESLLSQLNERSHTLLTHLNGTLHNTTSVSHTQSATLNTPTDTALDWIRTKHHAELAYIDLLIGHLLSPYYQFSLAKLPDDDTVSSDLWRPQDAAFLIDTSSYSAPSSLDRATPNAWLWGGRPTGDFLFTFILVFLILLGLLLFGCGLGLFFCLVRAHFNRSVNHAVAPATHRQPTSLHTLVTDGVLKVKHWIGRTASSRTARPWFRSSQTTASRGAIRHAGSYPVCASGQQQQPQLHGYFNPIYPSASVRS